MSTNAIIKQSYTTTFTFAGVPSKETRERLIASGFQFDGRSGQWYRSQKQSTVISEESVAEHVSA